MGENHEEKIEGVTQTGFAFCIPKDTLEDYEFVKTMATIFDQESTEEERTRCMFSLPDVMLGRKEAKKLIAHIRKNNDGKCKPADVEKELADIILSAKKDNDVKN